MKKTILSKALIVIPIFLISIVMQSCGTEKSTALTEKLHGNYLIGNWEGKQKIKIRIKEGIGKYEFITSMEDLNTELYINSNGDVKGNIGGATIKNAKVIANRGPILRTLSWATDFAIQGELEGALFEHDSIPQKSFTIPLSCDSFQLNGDVFQKEGLDLFPLCSINLKHMK
jgi:hypothetical protein